MLQYAVAEFFIIYSTMLCIEWRKAEKAFGYYEVEIKVAGYTYNKRPPKILTASCAFGISLSVKKGKWFNYSSSEAKVNASALRYDA